MNSEPTHHDACVADQDGEVVSTALSIVVGHRDDGSLCTTIRFATGERLVADAASPDLGFDEPDTVLHDVAHTLLATRLGLTRSPVLERVVELRPLSQRDVDLEEAAAFSLQAWCASLNGRDPGPAIANALTALRRLSERTEPVQYGPRTIDNDA